MATIKPEADHQTSKNQIKSQLLKKKIKKNKTSDLKKQSVQHSNR